MHCFVDKRGVSYIATYCVFCAIDRRSVLGRWVFWFVIIVFIKDIGGISWHDNVTFVSLVISF